MDDAPGMRHTPAAGPQGPGAYPSLSGRTVIVTGGGQGLGRAMTLALAERGADVTTIAARDPASLEATAAAAEGLEGSVRAMQADVREWRDCARVVESALEGCGRIEALVNNAARGTYHVAGTAERLSARFWEADRGRWVEALTTNVVGTYLMTAAAVPHMVAGGFGRIVNISTSDRSMVRPLNTPYGPSKAALEAMTRAWAGELGSDGVTANVLLPGGAADTRMATGVTRRPLLPVGVMNAAILWLCSDRSSGHTGGRYIGQDWDADAEPDDAAAGARQPSHELPAVM